MRGRRPVRPGAGHAGARRSPRPTTTSRTGSSSGRSVVTPALDGSGPRSTTTSAKKPIKDKTAAALGMKGTGRPALQGPVERREGQVPERVPAGVTVPAGGAPSTGGTGNSKILIHYKDENTGETWADEHVGGKPNRPGHAGPGVTVVGAEALPHDADRGGAAFSLAGAMGSRPADSAAGRVDQRVHGNYGPKGAKGSFASTWTTPADEPGNATLGCTSAPSCWVSVAGSVAPDGYKVQLAGKMARDRRSVRTPG